MYSDIQELERRNADDRLRRKGVPLLRFGGATQAAADMALHAHEWDNLPDGEPLVIQDKQGNLQAYAGLDYPLNTGNTASPNSVYLNNQPLTLNGGAVTLGGL